MHKILSYRAHILISCFDVSADHHAVELIEFARQTYPGRFVFSVIGGQELEKISKNSSFNDIVFLETSTTATKSTVGFLETARYILPTFTLFHRIVKYVKSCQEIGTKSPFGKIHLHLSIDGQGRNLPLADKMKKLGLKIAYFFPPPVSVWGKWNIKRLQRYDLVLNPFFQDHTIFQKNNVTSVYTGHPFATREKVIRTETPQEKWKQRIGYEKNDKILSVFPGSRPQEIKNLTNLFLKSAIDVKSKMPEVKCIISLSHERFAKDIEKEKDSLRSKLGQEQAKILDEMKIIYGKWDEILLASDFCILCSGSVTIKAAIYGKPSVCVYRISKLSSIIIRFLVTVDFISLPNILTNKEIYKELINKDATVDNISAEAIKYLSSEEHVRQMKKNLKVVLRIMQTYEPFDILLQSIATILNHQLPKRRRKHQLPTEIRPLLANSHAKISIALKKQVPKRRKRDMFMAS